MDEIREVLLRACTGMANGPDIMAQYDAQSAKLATQAEELKRLRMERDGYKATCDDANAWIEEFCGFLGGERMDVFKAKDQLTKQSAVVEAAARFLSWLPLRPGVIAALDDPSNNALNSLHELSAAVDALFPGRLPPLTTDTTDTGGEG